MITYALAAKLFESFSILRWNDRLRPIEIIEIDHHAIKSMLTYFLGKCSEYSTKAPKQINWRRIVDVNILDFLSKIATSDIQSRVREELRKETAFSKFVCDSWRNPSFHLDKTILDSLKKYLSPENDDSIEYKILRFSHKYTTSREFKVIESFSMPCSDLTGISNSINRHVDESIHSSFKREAMDLRDENWTWLPNIIGMIERLRFQTRWSQTPRIPPTSVLGHSMYCAVLAYFLSIEIRYKGKKLSNEQVVNNFYAALFHDLPEAISRDIISPVKKSSDIIEKLVAKIEKDLCEKNIMSQIPERWQSHFRFITGQMCPNEETLNNTQLDTCTVPYKKQKDEFIKHGEFSNRIISKDDKYTIVPWGCDKSPYSEPMEDYIGQSGLDGKLLKVCDNIAAFMEARMSLQHGIRSPHLDNGLSNSIHACKGTRLYNLNVVDFFDSITF
ncbi:MAG: HD domain-containing protein [Oscillospiraceae bacterium]|nr:HD domain-containing protein [Oscillospiraceae bacterium]